MSLLPRFTFHYRDTIDSEPGVGFYLTCDLVGYEGVTLYIYFGYLTLSFNIAWAERSKP